MRAGREGTVADIGEGYTLYARNGPLAKVLGTVPGSEEYGRRFSGYLYATGLYGASAQMWVPYEAVIAVYPETQSAFLSIKGDETEHFGWTTPPLSISRNAPRSNGTEGALDEGFQDSSSKFHVSRFKTSPGPMVPGFLLASERLYCLAWANPGREPRAT